MKGRTGCLRHKVQELSLKTIQITKRSNKKKSDFSYEVPLPLIWEKKFYDTAFQCSFNMDFHIWETVSITDAQTMPKSKNSNSLIKRNIAFNILRG